MWQSAGSSAPCCRTLALPAFLRSCSQGPSLWGCNGCSSLGLTSSHLQISEEKTSGHFSRSPSKVPTSSHWCCWICGQSIQCFDWVEVKERWALHKNLGLLAEIGGINVKEANYSCWLCVNPVATSSRPLFSGILWLSYRDKFRTRGRRGCVGSFQKAGWQLG